MLLLGNVKVVEIVTRADESSFYERVGGFLLKRLNPKAVILSKRIEAEQKEIYEALTEGVRGVL